MSSTLSGRTRGMRTPITRALRSVCQKLRVNRNLRKSVDESMVGDSDTTHPQITQIIRMRPPAQHPHFDSQGGEGRNTTPE
jgi:hypothetical protein